jgi:hypothetical protein
MLNVQIRVIYYLSSKIKPLQGNLTEPEMKELAVAVKKLY